MPETERPPAPSSIRTAVRVMYAGAVTSLIGIIINLVSVGATKTAIEKHSHHLTASQISSTQHVLVAGGIIGGLIATGVWIFMARSCAAGKSWARIVSTVLFGLGTIDGLIGLGAPIASAVKIYALVVWIVGLIAVICLWRSASSAWFKATGS